MVLRIRVPSVVLGTDFRIGRVEARLMYRLKAFATAPDAGRGQREFTRPGVSGHGDACRLNRGPMGGQLVSLGVTAGDGRRRDTRPAMLLLAVQARRLSTRSSLSKSVPCNIIVLAAGSGWRGII
jgi:hypothetical protein